MDNTVKQKVYSTEGAIAELGISKATFESTIKHKLTELPKLGRKRYYLYEEIQKVKKDREERNTRYEVIA